MFRKWESKVCGVLSEKFCRGSVTSGIWKKFRDIVFAVVFSFFAIIPQALAIGAVFRYYLMYVHHIVITLFTFIFLVLLAICVLIADILLIILIHCSIPGPHSWLIPILVLQSVFAGIFMAYFLPFLIIDYSFSYTFNEFLTYLCMSSPVMIMTFSQAIMYYKIRIKV